MRMVKTRPKGRPDPDWRSRRESHGCRSHFKHWPLPCALYVSAASFNFVSDRMQRSVEPSQEITINDPLEAATSTIASSPSQQSPFSNYVNNLSPIKAVNPTSKGFVGLNSLPSIFTSPQPRINPQGKRHHYWNSVDNDPVETHGHNVEEPPLLSRESHHGSEVGEKHCGMRKRLLQFDAVSSTPSSDTMAQLSEPMTSLFPLNGTGNIGLHLVSSNMGGTEDERHKFHASVAPGAVASLDPANAHDKRKLTWNSDQFNQPARSPEKKKKKTSSTTDGDSCKRCNCKKSKCLKLYCDCFAAGSRCGETCGCQGCFNKTEYEDKIVEAKQQIESRNPLAFAPKIVKRASSNIVDQAKHKRGCNCKKSMCSKRYCECYQANVGCSSGCRCDGCKNVYGRKDDYVAEHGLSKERLSSRVEKGLDSKFRHNNLGMVANMTDSLQFSNHVRQHLPSPEVAGVVMFPSESENSERNVLLAETNEILLGSGSYGWQLGYNNKKTMEIMDQSSATFNSHQRPVFKTRDDTHIPPRPLMSYGSSCLLSGWRNSTVTPTMTRLVQSLCSQHQHYDIRQDQTPEMLNQPVTPIQSVRASFPNQKRVSPPHTGSPQSASTSSAGFTSGNNSILKSMPSFLTVTPFKPNHHEDCINVDGSIPY